MNKSLQSLRLKLEASLSKHGAKAEISRRSGIHPNSIDRYLSGENVPSLDAVDQLADALEIDAWDLIKPSSASDNDLRMRIKSETAALLRREKELIDLAESALNVGGRPGMSELLGLVARLNDSQIQDYIKLLNAEFGLKTSKVKK